MHIEKDIDSSKCYLQLGLIVFFALIMRVLFPTVSFGTMTLAVVQKAFELSIGNELDPSNFANQRYMMLYPTALIFKLLGANRYTIMIFPIICSLGQIIVTFMIGRLLANKTVGLTAALLMAIYPLDIYVGTVPYPDGPLGFFIGLSILFFILAIKAESKKKANSYGLLSGVAIGLAFFIKESAIFIGTFFVLYGLFNWKTTRLFFAISLGFLIVVLMDCVYFYFTTDNFLHRFDVLLFSVHDSDNKMLQSAYSMRQRWHYIRWLSIPIYVYGGYFYFILLSMAVFIINKKIFEKGYLLAVLWFVGMLIHLSFGSLLGPISYSTQLARYLSIISIPAVLLIAFLLQEKRYWLKNTFVYVCVFILFLSSIISLNFNRLRQEASYADTKILTILHRLETKGKINQRNRIYAEPKTARALRFLNGYDNNRQFISLEKGKNALEKNSILIINKQRQKLAKKRHGKVYEIQNEIDPMDYISNPAPKIAYIQARAMICLIDKVPGIPQKITNKVKSEIVPYLDGKDTIIYRVL